MTSRQNHLGSAKRGSAIAALAALVTVLATWALPSSARAQDAPKEYGIAAKRPVLQASCKHCPWGALGDILKSIMAPAYDVAICYGCSGENGARYVSKRLMSAEVSDRLFAQGVSTRPDAPVDFGITQPEYVRRAYEGSFGYKKDGPFTNLRLIARIESPAYLMIAVDKASGITDLRQIRERKMPVRIMMGPNAAMLHSVLDYYGITEQCAGEESEIRRHTGDRRPLELSRRKHVVRDVAEKGSGLPANTGRPAPEACQGTLGRARDVAVPLLAWPRR
jgi:hypothetical protein